MSLASTSDNVMKSHHTGSLSGEPPPDDKGEALTLVRALCRELEERCVRYCHWKSNDALARSATAENDLDLLVSARDEGAFREILARLGFRSGVAPAAHAMPGVVDYYGYDVDAGVLVHVHAHYRLIIGDDRTKNYHLALESLYLESTSSRLGFRIPRPEVEFIGFVIRMNLKHASWDAVLERKGRLSKAERSEFQDLTSRVDKARLKKHLESMPSLAPVFEPCVTALEQNASVWSRIRPARRLQRALAPHARRTRMAELRLKAWRRVAQGVQRRLEGRTAKPRLASGGALVAVIGGDGAGKTTAVTELHERWRKELDVRLVHLGKPGWSRTTYCVRAALKLGRLLGMGRYVSSAEALYGTNGGSESFPGYGFVLRELCISRDRYLAYCKARQAATSGAIVVCDRFPLPNLTMDGPLLSRCVRTEKPNRFLRWLLRQEESYYRAIEPPDVLVILRVDPEIAVKRKPDEEPRYVRARSTEIWNFDARDLCHSSIDASRTRAEVAAEIRRLVWSAL